MPNRLMETRQFLQKVDKRYIVLAGREVQADLTGTVAAEIGVELACANLLRFLGRRRPGELGVQEATIAGEAAAPVSRRRHCLVGHRDRERLQLVCKL